MATLAFTTGNFKVFTPVSSALGALSNGPGTMMALVKSSGTGDRDVCGLLNSAGSSWHHTIQINSSGGLFDDANVVVTATGPGNGLTNWYWVAWDWSGSVAAERAHFRDQTAAGSWTHNDSSGPNNGNYAGPGTGGWFRVGYCLDGAPAEAIAVVAVWAGTRFADGDYGAWTKTSDLWNHANGHPTLLVQCNATTLVDLAGGSTYSSANSSGSALTGADPDNWTFDGTGSAATIVSPLQVSGPSYAAHRAASI